MKRNDAIAALIVAGLVTLGVLNKLDWGATVAYILGILQRQPSFIAGPATPEA